MSRDDPDEPEFGPELRQGAGREWVEEAAEDERWTQKLRERRSDLKQRALAMVAEGRQVRAELPSLAFTGRLTFAGSDYAVIDSGYEEVAIRLDAALWEIMAATGDGNAPRREPQSFRAHLAELEASGEVIRALTRDGEVAGRIRTVASDHVVAEAETYEMLIPIASLVGTVRTKTR